MNHFSLHHTNWSASILLENQARAKVVLVLES